MSDDRNASEYSSFKEKPTSSSTTAFAQEYTSPGASVTDDTLQRMALLLRVPVSRLAAVIKVESGGRAFNGPGGQTLN